MIQAGKQKAMEVVEAMKAAESQNIKQDRIWQCYTFLLESR